MDDKNENNGATEQLRGISKRLNEVMDLMRSQRDALRQKGINLPSGALDSLRTLKKRLDVLLRTVEDSQQELVSLRALAETSALINSDQSVDKVLDQVMDTVIKLTGAERGYIVLRNDAGEMEFTVARGMDKEALTGNANGGSKIVSTTIVNTVAETGEPVLTDNASIDERYQKQESVVGFSLRSILAVPLKSQDKIIGVVYCDNRFMAGLFKQHELEMLTSFASQAAVAIENARLFEDVRLRLQEFTQIQNRMRNLFDSITSGIITTDEDGNVLVANKGARSVTQKEKVVGKPLHDVLPDMNGNFDSMLDDVRNHGTEHTIDYEVEIDGNPRSWTVIASPLRGEGAIHGAALVIEDMTEQRKSEMQVRETLRYVPPALIDNLKGVDINEVSSEDREITALFADIRGFTSFSEKLPPDELMEIINKYLSLASDAISFGEGIVDKYMGDAVTGLFNTQLNPQEDHAARAIQTALHLVHDMNGLHDYMKEQGQANQVVFFGTGIHTGPAVLGNVGGKSRKEFSVLGEAMDICKFLQEQAGPGEVVISEYTYNMVKDNFQCEATPIVREKAGYNHIKCYKVIKPKKAVILDPELRDLMEELGDLSDLVADLDD